MFISIYAKKIGIKKIITKLNKLSFVDILGENSFQSIITPKKIIADNIVRVVRSIANKKKNLIENFYRLENNTVEAIEILVNSDSKINNIPLKDLKIKKNLIIAYIVRNNVAIFPKGTDVIKEGDRVIIITTESFFDDINNIIDKNVKPNESMRAKIYYLIDNDVNKEEIDLIADYELGEHFSNDQIVVKVGL